MIVGFTGHMTDLPERSTPRFPCTAEAAVADAAAAVLDRLEPQLVLGSAARGVDLLMLEAAFARGIGTQIVLPYSAGHFCSTSVTHASDLRWSARFHLALKRAQAVHEVVTSNGDFEALDFELANRIILGMLAVAAEQGKEISIAGVWDGQPGDGAGGTAAFLALAKAAAYDGLVVDLERLRAEQRLVLQPLRELQPGSASLTDNTASIQFITRKDRDAAGLTVARYSSAQDVLAALGADDDVGLSQGQVVIDVEGTWPAASARAIQQSTTNDEQTMHQHLELIAALERRIKNNS
jgi:hypothetical protein